MGQFELSPSGCWLTRQTNGRLIRYAEFNSNVLPHLGTRRYRLYQVGAVLAIKRAYPNLVDADFVGWAQAFRPEASHLCRYAVPFERINPDGSVYQLDVVEECKPCFNPAHMTMEDSVANLNRIRCRGGPDCIHVPPCLIVQDPIVQQGAEQE